MSLESQAAQAFYYWDIEIKCMSQKHITSTKVIN